MKLLLLVCLAGFAAAQAIPGRYIVEFEGDSASKLAATTRTRFSTTEPGVAARRSEIRAQHDRAQQTIQSLGGRVRARFDTVLNGMAVELNETAAAQLRRTPGVRGVYADLQMHSYLDHAMNVHKIRDAWQTVAGGQMSAGAGIKIGIIDSGIDITHPAFQGFTTAIPQGFPIASPASEAANANNKVIVVRDYTGLGVLDTFGHGTSVAMTAAGLSYDPKIGGFTPFTGVAPGAWLGAYRIVDDNGASSSSLFLQALQDAINDGMNIVNYSSGSPLVDVAFENRPEARAINAALAAGVLVTTAAGNAGPQSGTLGFPGAVSSAVDVGANYNERVVDDAVILPDIGPFEALAPSTSQITTPLTGPMTDVTAIDSTGFGCAAFPAASLKGQIALISRSIAGSADACAFDDKINHAADAGAIGVVVYNSDPAGGLVGMSLTTATLPATFILNSSGVAIKGYLATNPGATATIDFSTSTVIPVSPDVIPTFSSRGPTSTGSLKPDLLATGAWLATADTSQGNPYIPFTIQFGTSFAAPMVAGSAAVLMSARPGLTGAQYRSLLINSAPVMTSPTTAGQQVPPQTGGTGKLDLLRAVQNSSTAAPSSINFLTASGTVDVTQSVTISNVSGADDAFTVAVNPLNTDGVLTPAVDLPSFTLAAGASQAISVHMTGANPATGEYQGYLEITGTKSGVVTRVPYWLGVPGQSVKNIAFLQEVDPYPNALDTVSVYFRTTDAIGLPIDGGLPDVSTTAPRASVLSVAPIGTIPGTYQATLRIGRAPSSGTNDFLITAGSISYTLTFYPQ